MTNPTVHFTEHDWVAFMSQPYQVEVEIESEVDLRLRLRSRLMLLSSIPTFEFDLIWGDLFYFWGLNCLLLIMGVRVRFKNCFLVFSCS